jgi:hypothetical protein
VFDGGSLLLRQTDESVELADRLAGCFIDGRHAGSAAHSMRGLLA